MNLQNEFGSGKRSIFSQINWTLCFFLCCLLMLSLVTLCISSMVFVVLEEREGVGVVHNLYFLINSKNMILMEVYCFCLVALFLVLMIHIWPLRLHWDKYYFVLYLLFISYPFLFITGFLLSGMVGPLQIRLRDLELLVIGLENVSPLMSS